MAEENIKEVYYEHCKTCKYWEEPDDCDRCNECLNHPWNVGSHYPINYEEDQNASNKS